MNILIIGSGRMGIRHAQGVQKMGALTSAVMADISRDALKNAEDTLKDPRFEFLLIDELSSTNNRNFDVCVIAATAGSRMDLLTLARDLRCAHILIEKPLGQSIKQVEELSHFIDSTGLDCAVNLNMRLYENFIRLKEDLATLPQLRGEKTITVNTGTLGIGANGIHYLDLLFFLTGADRAELAAADIDEAIIPSGRGPQFADFGGWAVIHFFAGNEYLAKAILSFGSKSTVFGTWDIVAPHGRISVNEVEGKRIDTLRKADSQMPVNRYHADYQRPHETTFSSPALGDLTAKWIEGQVAGKQLLPPVRDSLTVHRLLFDWLAKSKTHHELFPIT